MPAWNARFRAAWPDVEALCDRLRAVVGDRLLEREALVFTEADGTPLKFGSFYSQRFKPAVRAVLPNYLEGLQFHDLRHFHSYAQTPRRAGRPSEGDGGADGPLVGADQPRPAQPRHAPHDLGLGGPDGHRLPRRCPGRARRR